MFMTADDVLYICNSEGNTILKMDVNASPLTVTRVAGNLFAKRYGGDGGFATDAQLNTPQGVWVMPDKTVYFSDSENHLVRKVAPDGKIATVAGDVEAARRAADTGQYPIAAESSGDGGPATAAQLNGPRASRRTTPATSTWPRKAAPASAASTRRASSTPSPATARRRPTATTPTSPVTPAPPPPSRRSSTPCTT